MKTNHKQNCEFNWIKDKRRRRRRHQNGINMHSPNSVLERLLENLLGRLRYFQIFVFVFLLFNCSQPQMRVIEGERAYIACELFRSVRHIQSGVKLHNKNALKCVNYFKDEKKLFLTLENVHNRNWKYTERKKVRAHLVKEMGPFFRFVHFRIETISIEYFSMLFCSALKIITEAIISLLQNKSYYFMCICVCATSSSPYTNGCATLYRANTCNYCVFVLSVFAVCLLKSCIEGKPNEKQKSVWSAPPLWISIKKGEQKWARLGFE